MKNGLRGIKRSCGPASDPVVEAEVAACNQDFLVLGS